MIGLLAACRKSDSRSWRLASTRRNLRPLLVAAVRGGSGDDVQVIEWLAANGIKPDLRDEQGRTVLAELSVENLRSEVASRLVVAGGDLDATDRLGADAAMARRGEWRASDHRSAGHGRSAAGYRERGEEVVRALLARGADPTARHDGWSPADSAHMMSDGGRYRHHVAMAQLLEQAAMAAPKGRGLDRPRK